MKIDLTKIEGYADMSAEEKLKALESYDVDMSGYVSKETFDKTASELASKKKELREKLSEDEQKKQADDEYLKTLKESYDKLLRESEIAKNKASLIGIGYAEDLAEKAAEAMYDGNTAKVLEYQKSHTESMKAAIKADLLKGTPAPVPDGGNNTMTLAKFRALPANERFEYAQKNPEAYESLYKE